MQLPSDTDLAAAIDDPDRVVIYKLEVDWDRDGTWDHALSDVTSWVTDLSVARTDTGDLPVEASLVEGTIAATLTATLGGLDETGLELTGKDGTSALDTFAPYRSDSPLFQRAILGCGVRCSMGLATDVGDRLITQFTGQLRSLGPDSRTREVVLNALDSTERLRAPITLPAHAIFRADLLASGHDQILINSQSVIDFVLRKNKIYASPPARSDAQISCTGHGWLAAEAGRSAVPRGVAPRVGGNGDWWVDGPFGMLAVGGGWDASVMYQEFFSREAYTPQAGNGFGVAAWVKVGNDMGVTAGTKVLFQCMPLVDHTAWKFELYITSGGSLGGVIDIAGVDSGYAQPISTTTQWMYVGLHFQHRSDGTTMIQYRQNGATTQGSVTTPALTSTVAPRLQMTAWTSVAWSNLQVWFDGNQPTTWPGETHTPQATLDRGLGMLTYLPDVVEQPSLDIVKGLVTAEFGLFGFDASGSPYFRSRATSTDPNTVDKTINADKALLDLAAEVNADSVRNVISTESKMGFLDFATKVVDARENSEYDVAVGVWTFDVPLAHSAIGTTTQTIPRIASASWSDTVLWGFVSVRADAPATELTSGVSVVATMIADRLMRLTIRNYTGFPVRFATTGGSAALRVQGYGLQLEPAQITQYRAEGSASLYGERVYKMAATDYRQYPATLNNVAGGLLSTLSDPMPVLGGVPIVGDPRLEPGDVVRLVDDQGQGSFRAYVVGLRQAISGGKLSTELTPRPIVSPGFGLLDDDELGISDDSLILAP